MAGPATRVLVADDDASLVQTLTWILKENGYEVAVCPGGEGLFAKLEEIKPAILLLDIMMPRWTGSSCSSASSRTSDTATCPSSWCRPCRPKKPRCARLGLGAADFISKPFRVRELLARVEAHIRVGRALAQAREEARSRAAMVDILHEVTDSLKPDEMYHILARRVARALNISKCSMVLAKPGDHQGVVVAAYENPMLRNLQIDLAKYPEIRKAVSSGRLVLVEDVGTDPLYEEERRRWEREEIKVPTRSAVALPFWMKDQQTASSSCEPPETIRRSRAPTRSSPKRSSRRRCRRSKRRTISRAPSRTSSGSRSSPPPTRSPVSPTAAGCRRRSPRSSTRARRYNLALTILLADIDRFKTINDTRGHIGGRFRAATGRRALAA